MSQELHFLSEQRSNGGDGSVGEGDEGDGDSDDGEDDNYVYTQLSGLFANVGESPINRWVLQSWRNLEQRMWCWLEPAARTMSAFAPKCDSDGRRFKDLNLWGLEDHIWLMVWSHI